MTEFELPGDETLTVTEAAAESTGFRGTFNVVRADFSELESTTVLANVPDREDAVDFAEDYAKAYRQDERRDAFAERLDKQRKAELTRDLDKWSDNPDEFDFPGVDSPKDEFGPTVDDVFEDLGDFREDI